MPRYREPFTLYPRKMKDGKRIWYYRTYNEDGMRTSGISTGETSKTKARIYCQDLLVKGTLTPGKDMLLSVYAADWWIWRKCNYLKGKLLRSESLDKPQISRAYAENNRQILRKYILPVFGHIRLSCITPIKIEKWIIGLKEKNRFSNSWINRILGCLRIMMREALRFNYVHSNPVDKVKPLGAVSRARGILNLEEVRRLFEGDALEKLWDNKLIQFTANMLAASTGIRQGAIRAIREENYFGNYIHVAHSYGKYGLGPTKTRDTRDVPVPQKVQYYMNQLVGKGGYIFSVDANGEKPVTSRMITYSLYIALDRIGIGPEERKQRNINFHSWRHFFNTYCRGLNIPDAKIQRMTGHTTREMVEHYTHFSLSDFREIVEAQERLLG